MTKTAVRAMTREDLEREIQDRNARFDALSPAERRVAIALDVLDQVKRKRYNPVCMRYVEAESFSDGDPREIDAQQWVDGGEPCRVCAIGAAAVSAFALFDQTAGKSAEDAFSFEDDGGGRAVLLRYFGEEQTELLESAFEDFTAIGVDPALERKAREFGRRYSTTRGRFRAIWRNVVKNGGTFVP